MDKLLLMREMFARAYELAVFIHGDEKTAIRIVAGAASKLEVAITSQNKRLYYKPNRSRLSRASRSIGLRHKILLCDSHLLQRLIYIESEPFERAKEHEGAVLGQAEMVRFFIKHLVRITLRRNSFYVSLGLCRLLYNYNTAETMQIYNVVIQDPERVKDDYYYRSRKGVLMSELKDRFGDLLRTSRGPHGEERFQGSNSHEYASLVKECLAFFTLWSTPCLLMDGFDPIASEIPCFVSGDPADEDRTEAGRIHALIHPDCFDRLIRALRFDSPEERLTLPHFFLKQKDQDRRGPNSSNQDHPKLDENIFKAIEEEIADLALRRKRFTNGRVRVIVDGVEQVSWESSRAGNSGEITIADNTELIEIKASDAQGDLLLATYLIHGEEDFRKSLHHKIVLEGGQEVAVNLSPSPSKLPGCILTVTYRERTSAFATLSSFYSLLTGLFDLPLHVRRRAGVSLIALAVMCLVFTVIGVKRFTQRARLETTTPTNTPEASPGKATVSAVANQSGSVAGSSSPRPEPGPTVNNADEHRTQARLRDPSRRDGARGKGGASEGRPRRTVEAATVERQSDSERTRDLTLGPSVVSLRQVRKIFLEPLENRAQSQEIGAQLLDHFRAPGTPILVESAEEADAVLKLYPLKKPNSKANSKSLTVSAVLTNVNGDLLWPLRQKPKGTSYSGLPSEVGGRIASDLLRDFRRSQ